MQTPNGFGSIAATLATLVAVASCSTHTGFDPNSGFGGWTYHRETSLTYAEQHVVCRQTGSLNFLPSDEGVGGTWVASVNRCDPDSVVSPGPVRGSIVDAHVSASRAIFSLGDCSYDAGLQASSQGGRPISGTGLLECTFTATDGQSVTQTGTLTMARSINN